MAVEIEVCGPLEPPLEHIRETCQDLVRRGATGIWFPDHLIGFFPQAVWDPRYGVAQGLPGPNDVVDTFIAAAVCALAARPKRVGMAVTDPLRRHPASLLQSAATVAASGVEFVLGIGGGAAPNIGPFGLDMASRFRALTDAVALLRDLRDRDEPITRDYGTFRLDHAVLGIAERRQVKIWIGGSGPGGARLAGRAAEGWMPTRMSPTVYADNFAQMRSAAAKAGRSLPTASMYVWSLVCDTHAAADALLSAPFLRSLLFFRGPEFFLARGLEHPLAGVAPSTDYLPTRLTREQAERALERVPESLVRDYVVHGTPAEVRRWTAEMERAGMQHVVLYDIAPYVQGGAAASKIGDLLGGAN